MGDVTEGINVTSIRRTLRENGSLLYEVIFMLKIVKSADYEKLHTDLMKARIS